MESRKPFEIKNILIIYNLLQTIWSFYMFVEIGRVAWFGRYNWRCQAIDRSTGEYAIRVSKYMNQGR